jgi:hypothetical protein
MHTFYRVHNGSPRGSSVFWGPIARVVAQALGLKKHGRAEKAATIWAIFFIHLNRFTSIFFHSSSTHKKNQSMNLRHHKKIPTPLKMPGKYSAWQGTSNYKAKKLLILYIVARISLQSLSTCYWPFQIITMIR